MPAGPALGDNQLVNFTFDENLDGWTLFAAPDEAAWDPLDVADSPDSGSALLSQEESGFLTMIGQCVPVTGGELHSMSSWIFVPGGQNADGRAGIEFEWFSSSNCEPGDGLGTVIRELGPLVEGGWTFLPKGATAPDNAVAAQSLLRIKNNDGVFDWQAHFDDAAFDRGIWPGLGFTMSATGDASVDPDGQGNFTISGIGDTLEDGVDLGFGVGTVFEATDQPIITPATLADAISPSDLAGAVTPSDFHLELAGPIEAEAVQDNATLEMAVHALLGAGGGAQGLGRAVTPSNVHRSALVAVRATQQQEAAWFTIPSGAGLFPQGMHTLVLKNDGQKVFEQSSRTDPLLLNILPRDLMLRRVEGQLQFSLTFETAQSAENNLQFDEAIFRSEVEGEVRDFLPAVQVRLAHLPAVQISGASVGSGSVRLSGLGQGILNLQPDGRMVVENFGDSGNDGVAIGSAVEFPGRVGLEFAETLLASEVNGTVEGPQPCLSPGEPLARFQAQDVGDMFETTAEFFGTGGTTGTHDASTDVRSAERSNARQSDSGTLRIYENDSLVTEVEAFTGTVNTAHSLGRQYNAWVCEEGRLCNEFVWPDAIEIELSGTRTFTGDRLVWVLGGNEPLPPDSVHGIEYVASDSPPRSITAAEADEIDTIFADRFRE